MTLLGVGVSLQVLALALWTGGLLFCLRALRPAVAGVPSGLGVVANASRSFHVWEALAAILMMAGSGVLYVGKAWAPGLWINCGLSVAMFVVLVAYAAVFAPPAQAAPAEPDTTPAGPAESVSRAMGVQSALMALNLVLALAQAALLGLLVSQSAVVVIQESATTMPMGGFGGF
jgi:hypothetical protein